jgi:hypothetical protein
MNKLYGNYERIQKGDIVYTEGVGACSGGASYDIGETVLEVTTTNIITKDGHYSRTTGRATNPPLAYYIAFWKKEESCKMEARTYPYTAHSIDKESILFFIERNCCYILKSPYGKFGTLGWNIFVEEECIPCDVDIKIRE